MRFQRLHSSEDFADPARLIQVLTNLLVNTLRYTPAPGKARERAFGGSGIGLTIAQSLAHA